MLETEYKCLIDKETYERIENAYKWDYVKEQTNYYYIDEAHELSKHKITVRIREKDGQFKLQIKTHKNSDTPLHISEEKEFKAYGVPEFLDAEKIREITGLNNGRLIRTGSLTTLRHSIMCGSNVEICLDKSTYFDCTDYELEVEYTGTVPNVLFDELKSLGAEFRGNTAGKYTRFKKRLGELIKKGR